ncbi:uncharacterized protein LOC136095992 [Hydra vulgaris]|uniref:uncharacterized protein LOC136095992 n=1 Tax=Hydra vulgaris TaxID=6087 RepID=UPI0032EA3BCA
MAFDCMSFVKLLVTIFILYIFAMFLFDTNSLLSNYTDNWKDKVYKKLEEVFRNDGDTFVRVTLILGVEEKTNQLDMCLHLQELKSLLHDTESFRIYAKTISENLKLAEKIDEFKKNLYKVYDVLIELKKNGMKYAGIKAFILVWEMISREHRNKIISYVKAFVNHEMEFLCGEIDRASPTSLELPNNTTAAICHWWYGKISGFECSIILVQSFSETFAVAAGGATGAAIGAYFGPTGMVFGGVIGAILSHIVVEALNERIKNWLLGVRKEKALENAFNFFELPENASQEDIKAAYRKMVLIHHPDKGGKAENFYYVQINMAVIKAARGEL